ncbi:MAG: A/G-specific adenine glycosylase, partial [Clostridia bacterium]|nr:A/G-specific adenine glycosylase [Clostridia bacterium]
MTAPLEPDWQAAGRALLDWFAAHARDLPWRRDRADAYRVLVSEFMLQQTRVDTVVPYYHRFLRRFPTLADLAEAEEEEVLKAWEGLGYYGRARRLHAAVREVQARYGGHLPVEADDLQRLPGVGAYTAAAVSSIAYGRDVIAMDGNVLRVAARLFRL